MDLLLERFLAECYPALAEPDRRAFEQLVEEPDLDILSWVTGRADCPTSAYGTCIGHLRRLQGPAAATRKPP